MILAIVAPLFFWGGLYLLPISRALKIVVAVFALAVSCSGYASAQALPSSPFPVSTTGNAFVFSGGTTSAANAASITFGNAANGAVYADVATSVRTAGGSVVPVVARTAPTGLAVAKALGGLVKAATGLGTVLAVGYAVYDVAKALGFNLDNSQGALTVTKSPTLSTVGGYDVTGIYGTPAQIAACSSAYGNFPCGAMAVVSTADKLASKCRTSAAGMCIEIRALTWPSAPSPGIGMYVYTSWFIPGGVLPTGLPSTVSDFETAIASQTGWPAGSRVGAALKDAVASGQPLALPKPSQITGPLEVAYPPKTVTNPDGSKTVTTKKEKITYGPDSTIKVDTEETAKTYDSSGVPTGTTVTTESPNAPDPKLDDGSVSDTPLSDVPKLYTPKYPNGLTGVWAEKITAIKALPLFNAAANLMPNVAAGGTCPHWFINLNLGPNMNYGSHDVAPPCWIWDFGKFVIVISALLLARRLVFGG